MHTQISHISCVGFLTKTLFEMNSHYFSVQVLNVLPLLGHGLLDVCVDDEDEVVRLDRVVLLLHQFRKHQAQR